MAIKRNTVPSNLMGVISLILNHLLILVLEKMIMVSKRADLFEVFRTSLLYVYEIIIPY